MAVGWKTILVAMMAVVVIALTIRARRRNFDRFRARHTRRKHRVALAELEVQRRGGPVTGRAEEGAEEPPSLDAEAGPGR